MEVLVSNKLYVGNISFSSTEEGISNLFGQHGSVVSVNIIKDRETGRSRGFCFVEMTDEPQATAAIAALNGTEFDGRRLTVNEAKEREPRTGSRPFRGGDNRGDRRSY
jgi:RNA recognition motif-containing protein